MRRTKENDFLALLGDNARKGQRHIRDFVLSLVRLFIDNNADYNLSDVKRDCLYFSEWLLQTYKIRDYLVTQSLILDDEERFSNFCQLTIDQMLMLDDGTRDAVQLESLGELNTDADKYDNAFNYLLVETPKRADTDGLEHISFFLYGIRVLQLVREGYYTFGAIEKELKYFGYDSPTGYPLNLVLKCLIRAQFLSVRPDEVVRGIQDLKFYCTGMGVFLLTRLIFDISYVGRAARNSVLPRFVYDAAVNTEGLTRRSTAITEIWNSMLVVLNVGVIEEWEAVNLRQSGAEGYLTTRLYNGMKVALTKQANKIFEEAERFGTAADKRLMADVVAKLKEPKYRRKGNAGYG